MTRTLGPWRFPNRSVKRPVPPPARFESEDQFWLAVRELNDLSQRFCDASRLLWFDPTRGRRLTPSGQWGKRLRWS